MAGELRSRAQTSGKGWWRRNRRWCIPLIGLIVCWGVMIWANTSFGDLPAAEQRRTEHLRDAHGGWLLIIWMAALLAAVVFFLFLVIKGFAAFRDWRRSAGLHTKSEKAEIQRQGELQRVFDHQWNAALRLARSLERGQLPHVETVWGVVLEPGETILGDGPAQYARWYGTNATYTHTSGFYFGRTSLMAGFALGNAIGNAARASAARAAAVTTWRELQQVRVLITTHRLLCQMGDGRWLSFYYSAATAVYPEPHNWSLVMDFGSRVVPLRIAGPAAASACVAAVWATHGADGLLRHPALASLRPPADH